MGLEGDYLGMPVRIDDLDTDNLEFFGHCGKHELRLQQCTNCDLKRYPPTTACPFCSHPDSTWQPTGGRGTVYSYGEVHHAIQPVFRPFTPYLILLVELDEQRNAPQEFDGLRINGNLVDADANMANAELVSRVGIGSRVQVVFKDIGEGIAVPLWTLDEDAQQPAIPWRYAIE